MSENKLGRYILNSILGQGAMGIVYKAYDPEIGRDVAIKTIRLDLADSSFAEQELRSRFLNEARSAGTMSHPNIVTIYDVGSQGSLAFIAMEFIQGNDLKEYMSSKGNLSFQEIYRVIHSVARGLDYSSSKGIIHRDIKPANILMTDNGEVKITDFGIAKLPTSTVTQSGMLMGTPAYISPEQVMGNTIDMRSDLYSLGVIFYELLVGKRPFSGDPTTVIFQVVQSKPPTPVITLDGVPDKLQEVVLKALSKKPSKRFQTGEEFIDAIKALPGIDSKTIDVSSKMTFSPLPKRKEKTIPANHITRIIADSGAATKKGATGSLNDQMKTVVLDTSPSIMREKRVKKSIRQFILFVIMAGVAYLYFQPDLVKPIIANILGEEQTIQNNINPIIPKPEKTVVAAPLPELDPGDFRIISLPEGAKILVDDQDTGLVTPAVYHTDETTPEEFNLKIEMDCYAAFDEKIAKATLPADGINAQLQLMEKEISLIVEPADAKVIVDGEEIEMSSPAKLALVCGQPVKVEISKDEYISKEVEIDFQTVEEELTIKLEKILKDGKVSLRTSYPVTVYEDGKKLGSFKRSWQIELPEGEHSLKFVSKKPVFINSTFKVKVKPEAPTSFTLPKPGTISVTSIPGNARIWIDRTNIDDAPLVDFKISAGNHTLRYVWPDGKKLTKKIKVKSGKKQTIRNKKP